ncbi:MAG: TSUP family transporter [Candidatus Margulisiibacteriota bacterium]
MLLNLELILIIIFSTFVQAAFGFGFNLFFLSIGSLFFPAKSLLPFCLLIALFVDSFIMFSTISHRPKKYYDFVFFGILATPIGLWLYFQMGSRVFDPLLGLLLIAAIVLQIYDQISIPNKNPVRSILGITLGSVAGAFGILGPFISVILLSDRSLTREGTIFLMNLFFTGVSFISLIVFYSFGVYDNIDLSNFIYMLFYSFIGFLLGGTFGSRFTTYIYKNIVLMLIFISAVLLIIP